VTISFRKRLRMPRVPELSDDGSIRRLRYERVLHPSPKTFGLRHKLSAWQVHAVFKDGREVTIGKVLQREVPKKNPWRGSSWGYDYKWYTICVRTGTETLAEYGTRSEAAQRLMVMWRGYV